MHTYRCVDAFFYSVFAINSQTNRFVYMDCSQTYRTDIQHYYYSLVRTALEDENNSE